MSAFIMKYYLILVFYSDQPARVHEPHYVLRVGQDLVELFAEVGELVPQPHVAGHLLLLFHTYFGHLGLKLLNLLVNLNNRHFSFLKIQTINYIIQFTNVKRRGEIFIIKMFNPS